MNQLSEMKALIKPRAASVPLPSPGAHPAITPGCLATACGNHHAVFTAIMSSAPLGVFRTDLAGKLLPEPARSPATPPPAAQPAVGMLHPQQRETLGDSWHKAMQCGGTWSEKFEHRAADGGLRFLHCLIGRLCDEQGVWTGYHGCNIDLTEETVARAVLAKSEERYRVAVEASDAGVWEFDVLEGQCRFSPYCYEMLGYSGGQMQGRFEDWTNIVHPECMEEARRVRGECISGVVQRFELELRLKTDEGKWRWFRCKGKAAKRDPSGRALKLAGTLLDINEPKMMEHLLRMEHDLLNLITTTSPVGIMFIEPEGNVAFANPRAESILGLAKAEMMSCGEHSPVWGLIAQGLTEDGGGELSLGEIVKTGHTVLNACFRFSRCDGQDLLLSISTAPYLDKASKISGTVVTLEDVTEQKRREQVVADNDKLLRETQRIAQLGSYVLDLAHDRWDCSSKLEEILGMERDSPKTLRGHIEVVHQDFQELFMESYLASITTGRPFEMEYKIRRHSDGVERWVTECSERSKEAAGTQLRMIGTIKDITERKAAEEAIRNLNDELDRRVIERTSQLEAAKKEIESFSYSVSHDLRAPLRHINSYSSILVEEYGGILPEEARYYLERICTASSRMGKQIDDLLTLTRVGRTVMKRETFNMSQMAAEVVDMLRVAKGVCGTDFVVQKGVSAYADSLLVRLVLQNLLSNSVKYSSLQAEPRVEFGQATISGRHTFYVRDNGVGFDMAYADKLFQPFQRLHGAQFEGNGIGLATVRRIIERHGGSIWAEGKENGGATFYFTLSPPRKSEQHR